MTTSTKVHYPITIHWYVASTGLNEYKAACGVIARPLGVNNYSKDAVSNPDFYMGCLINRGARLQACENCLKSPEVALELLAKQRND